MLSRTLIISFCLLIFSCTEGNETDSTENLQSQKSESRVKTYDPSCEWCGANEAPDELNWETTIAQKNEPGERMIITGTVFEKDGQTPASDVIVYVYHTNSEGIYPKKGDETGNAKRHGYLRGWMKTNENGQYKFESIRPAAYQSHGGEPAHIHYVIKAQGKKEYWISALVFDDDPRLDSKTLKNVKRDGGFGNITQLKLDSNGTLTGRRDIIIQNF